MWWSSRITKNTHTPTSIINTKCINSDDAVAHYGWEQNNNNHDKSSSNTSESRLEFCNNIQQLVSNHSNLLLTAMRPEYEFKKKIVYLWRDASPTGIKSLFCVIIMEKM